MTPDEAARRILRTLEDSDSPLPVAAALNVLGINPFNATEDQVRFLLLAVSGSGRLRLVRDDNSGFDVVAQPLPVEGLLNVLHRAPDPLPNPLELFTRPRGSCRCAARGRDETVPHRPGLIIPASWAASDGRFHARDPSLGKTMPFVRHRLARLRTPVVFA